MANRPERTYCRAGGQQPSQPRTFAERWWGKALLLLLSIALLTLAFAPFKQFYLTYVALVPWLLVLRQCRSTWSAFAWSWLGGLGFFLANMWWLAWVTGPGMAALLAVLGLYWGAAGAIIFATRILAPDEASERPVRAATVAASVLFIAVTWVALEWLRGTWPLGGLPWLYLGHTQTPVLHLCQIADITGVYGISFWIVLVNACVAFLLIHRRSIRAVLPACIITVVVIAGATWYGFFRFAQHTTLPGPIVLVVQPNYPQSNSGEKGAPQEAIVADHLLVTREALRHHPDVDLVVWSETMMPALNAEAREFAAKLDNVPAWRRHWYFLDSTDQTLIETARHYHTSLLAGGMYYSQWTITKNKKGEEVAIPRDRRNAAFYFTPKGQSEQRYDKIHLVPFGEYLPFKSALPPLYRLFLALSPYPEEYTLTAGQPDAMTVFPLDDKWHFVTPICFEDLDPNLMRRMCYSAGDKRADFIVNITNDGWFRYNEMPQHLQAAIFRSIENRVPTARSVNTGISGFINSMGQTSGLVSAGTEGVSVQSISLDSRTTFYSRFGDVFAENCAVLTALVTLGGIIRRVWRRRRSGDAK